MPESLQSENEKVIRRAFDLWARGDLDGYYALYADDAELIEPGSLPYGGTYRGLEQIRAVLEKMAAHWRDASVELQEMTSGGDCVITLLDFKGVGAKTGIPVHFTIAEVWRLRDGRIVFCNPIYGDTVLACNALAYQ